MMVNSFTFLQLKINKNFHSKLKKTPPPCLRPSELLEGDVMWCWLPVVNSFKKHMPHTNL